MISEKGMFRTVDKLILASASPRRRSFLRDLGLAFDIRAAAVDELPLAGEAPQGFVRRIAEEKAQAVSRRHPASWVLAADTVVVADHDILGKPENEAAAKKMLKRLSNRTHEVWTGFCLCRKQETIMVRQAVRTEVRFISLTDDLCEAYVATGEPLDKAGSYGIQGMGGVLVEKISGSYSNVVGLPLAEVVQQMLGLGIIVPSTDECSGPSTFVLSSRILSHTARASSRRPTDT